MDRADRELCAWLIGALVVGCSGLLVGLVIEANKSLAIAREYGTTAIEVAKTLMGQG